MSDELPRLRLVDELHARNAQGPMEPERYKDLLIAAYDDEDLADKMAAQYLLELMKANQ